MSISFYFGNELPQTPPVELDSSAAFRILVLADLGSSIPWGKPSYVDCDDLDSVLQKLHVQVNLTLGESGPTAQLDISKFDDFHPDQIFSRMELFQALKEQRQRLQNPNTFQQEIATSHAVRKEQEQNQKAKEQQQGSTPADSSILDMAVDLAQARQIPLETQILSGTIDWDAYVRQLAAPFLVNKPDPRQAEMLANLDATITSAMQCVLHHPHFQQIEATWTGIRYLTQRLETNRTLQIAVLNVNHRTLRDDLTATDNLAQSQLYKLLVEQPQVDQVQPWTLVLGDYTFGSSPEETQLLGRIAKVCAAARSMLISGACPKIAGCPGFDIAPDAADWTLPPEEHRTAWNELRELPESQAVVLALPRLLARRAYGRETDPIESFAFEELPNGTEHHGYLWMNAAYGIALLQGEAFSQHGWDFKMNVGEELKRLPIHYYVDEGEECIKACAEAYLVDRSSEKLAALGLSVARSVKNEGEVRFERIKSISARAH